MSEVLGSWKEIAAYLKKGVRTVQRWEAEMGLPVHRPVKAKKGVVLAYSRELDRWCKRHPLHMDPSPTRQKSRQARELAHDLLKRSVEIRQLAQSLIKRCESILNETRKSPPPA